jgi:hypothetical protein
MVFGLAPKFEFASRPAQVLGFDWTVLVMLACDERLNLAVFRLVLDRDLLSIPFSWLGKLDLDSGFGDEFKDSRVVVWWWGLASTDTLVVSFPSLEAVFAVSSITLHEIDISSSDPDESDWGTGATPLDRVDRMVATNCL